MRAILYSDDGVPPSKRLYTGELLAHLAGEIAEIELAASSREHPPGLANPGVSFIPAPVLDQVFDAVTLKREVDSGHLDTLGRFDETAVGWDVTKPWVDSRAIELLRGDAASTPENRGRDRGFQIVVTHDVDRVSGLEPVALAKEAVSKLGLGPTHAPTSIPLRPSRWLANIERLLEVERERGIGATYFLLSGPYGLRRHSSRYDIRWKQALAVARLVTDAGMRVGLHGGFNARDRNSYADERRRLEDALGTAVTCHRNHYLRFDSSRIWGQLENAGMSHDFSVGFRGRIGFRAGCAHAYPTFDLSREVKTSVISVPLLLMDTALLSGKNGDLLPQLGNAIQDVKRVGGCVSLLFHPENFLGNDALFSCFSNVLDMCTEMGADLSGRLPEVISRHVDLLSEGGS